jgi:dihydroxyacetone kinase
VCVAGKTTNGHKAYFYASPVGHLPHLWILGLVHYQAQTGHKFLFVHSTSGTCFMASSSRTLVNNPGNAVVESIEGYLVTRPDLIRLRADDHAVKIVARRHIDRTKVALVSGGGAGHEPSHVGWVGCGMLTAAVSGDVFASPHVRAIVTALRFVAGLDDTSSHDDARKFPGILLIVKNYTGDRLAFGLAAETVKAEGVQVEVVYVADDAAVDGGPVTGRRGIAGTVLVHKAAGAIAEAGGDLVETARAARLVASSVWSMGASLTVCSVPGVSLSERLSGSGSMIELGLGIHGEPGAHAFKHLLTADEVAAALVKQINTASSHGGDDALRKVVALINNLGGLSNLEMGVLIRSITQAMRKDTNVVLSRLIVGPLMTALDMRGVSLSILTVDDSQRFETLSGPMSILNAMDAPTACPSWPGTIVDPAVNVGWKNIATRPTAVKAESSTCETTIILVTQAQKVISSCTAALRAAASHLNDLDQVSGDGDCGHTMCLIADAVDSALPHVTAQSTVAATMRGLLQSLGSAVGNVAGGTSGVLYAIMLHAAANSVDVSSALPLLDLLALALTSATAAASRYASASAGDRTMLDVFIPVAAALTEAAKASGDVKLRLEHVLSVAEAGALATATMAPRAGRSAYVQMDRIRGSPDPGAVAALTWLQAAIQSV